METLKIEGKEDTPSIILDREKEMFEISGRSLPEDVTEFYDPVLNWIDLYLSNPLPKMDFHFKLEYFNTASSKILLDIMLKLEEGCESSESEICIKWHYDPADRDLQEAGEEYSELIEISFELVPIS